MMRQFQVNSYLFGGNAPYVEELYERYLDNPGSVPEKWRAYFDQMQLVPGSDGSPDTRDIADAPIVESFAQRAKANAFVPKVAQSDLTVAASRSTSSRSSRRTGFSETAGRISIRCSARSARSSRNWSPRSTT